MRQASERWTSDPRLLPLFPPCCVQALWLHVPAAQGEQGTKKTLLPLAAHSQRTGKRQCLGTDKEPKTEREKVCTAKSLQASLQSEA